ncbi:MAG: hypothetical protein ACO3FE_22475, partial [Planctomycetaceae bacterium]
GATRLPLSHGGTFDTPALASGPVISSINVETPPVYRSPANPPTARKAIHSPQPTMIKPAGFCVRCKLQQTAPNNE